MARTDDEFLGGGVTFNKVGNHPTGDEVAPIVDQGIRPHHIRRIAAVVALIVLAVVLYLVGEAGLIPGIQHAGVKARTAATQPAQDRPAINPDAATSPSSP